jgi:ectoine hydroxylase-related dioxygenase (phytanoyl-CoA dioxygenase family)
MTEENGGTELWPGTHLVADNFEREMSAVNPPGYSNDHAEERGALRPSVRMHAPRGTIMIRDMRMWHRARHNRTAVPRPMLSLVYNPSSVEAGTRPAEQCMPEATAARLSERGRRLYRGAIAEPNL